MNESIVTVRYTKALFNKAIEVDLLDAVKDDMKTVFEVMNESKELLFVFKNPILKPSKKQEVIKNIFNKFNQLTLSFINLLIKNRREEFLHDISRNFLTKYTKSKGIEFAVLTTAHVVDADFLEKVKEVIKNTLKTDIEIKSQTDQRIIGGFIIRVGDNQLDASVQSNLKRFKKKLLNTTIN